MSDTSKSASPKPVDPVRARRQKIAKFTLLANRVGYLFYALAIATFIIGFAISFNATVSAVVIGSLIIGSILLAPAIVLGYAVKAAERDDRERGL
jgi:cytochrome b561